jgi:uncharacterized protein YndB with AHSA1/START domain
MWSHEYAVETSIAPASVWAVLADVNSWARWDTSMEWVRLDGDLAVGSTVRMKPLDQDEAISSTIVAVEPERRYADRTRFGGVVLDFSHALLPTGDGGTRVVHRLEISGEDADRVGPELGPQITADFPEAMAALLACAGR